MKPSPTGHGIVQQLHVALSVIVEEKPLPPSLANHSTLLGTALHTVHKILESGHCYQCPIQDSSCSLCRAMTFRDFVVVEINGRASHGSGRACRLRLLDDHKHHNPKTLVASSEMLFFSMGRCGGRESFEGFVCSPHNAGTLAGSSGVCPLHAFMHPCMHAQLPLGLLDAPQDSQ